MSEQDARTWAPTGATPTAAAPEAPPRGRNVPVRLLALVAVLAVGGVVTAVVLGRPDVRILPTPAAEMVTLPAPTPTIEPVVRPAGSAFFTALPATVLSFALIEATEDPTLLATGALEGYRLVYSDGGTTTVTVRATQWRDAAAAEAALDAVIALPAEAGAPAPEVGVVDAGGATVGRSLVVEHADGTATVWWTNASVLMQADGPAAAARDLYTAFPL